LDTYTCMDHGNSVGVVCYPTTRRGAAGIDPRWVMMTAESGTNSYTRAGHFSVLSQLARSWAESAVSKLKRLYSSWRLK
jgi:hypothetical protein